MATDEEKLEALFDKLVGGKKKSKKASPAPEPKKKELDPLEEAVKEAVANAKKEHDRKVPKQFQNGSGYDYTKVWNEKTNDFDYVSTARVRMAKYLGRALERTERVWFFNRKKKGEEKYEARNLILGDQSGPFLDTLVCEHCGTQGKLIPNHATKQVVSDRGSANGSSSGYETPVL